MTELQWLEIFGDNLKDMMDSAGYTQRDLADDTGLSEATISKYINKQQMPGVKSLISIAYVLDCSLDDLMDFGDRIV